MSQNPCSGYWKGNAQTGLTVGIPRSKDYSACEYTLEPLRIKSRRTTQPPYTCHSGMADTWEEEAQEKATYAMSLYDKYQYSIMINKYQTHGQEHAHWSTKSSLT